MSAKTKHEPSQPEWEEHASEGWPSRDGIFDVDRFWWESGTSFDDMSAIELLFSWTIWSMDFFCHKRTFSNSKWKPSFVSLARPSAKKVWCFHNLHDFATTRGRVDVDELKKKRKLFSRLRRTARKAISPSFLGLVAAPYKGLELRWLYNLLHLQCPPVRAQHTAILALSPNPPTSTKQVVRTRTEVGRGIS